MTTTVIGTCVHVVDGDLSTVTLPDGRVIRSFPHATPEYEELARRLGYPDGAAMSREHDAIHVAIALQYGRLPPALVDVAEGMTRDRGFEEDLVKLVALRLNDPAADDQPGGGFVKWLRALLRPCSLGA